MGTISPEPATNSHKVPKHILTIFYGFEIVPVRKPPKWRQCVSNIEPFFFFLVFILLTLEDGKEVCTLTDPHTEN